MAFSLRGDDVTHAIHPTPIPNPYWVAFSASAAKLIGLELDQNGLPQDPAWLELLAGNTLSTANQTFSDPVATVYSGHQFGVWAGQLGDGRAILLGEISEQELQLKGAGKTRYSRMGDGRAVLRSSIREFLCSEAMQALGVPTSRALAVVGSDLPVRRESMETAAVCARLAPSFIRIGHFEHFASTNNIVRLKELADILIQDHFLEADKQDEPYLELFSLICERNAKLVAQWQAIGFCHGVLNSDNISALGITIDYGPFGFIDYFQIDHICNHSDHAGRYAYHRQPQIMHWNMACLANAFTPLLELTQSLDEAHTKLREALDRFAIVYAQEWQKLFRQKLGLSTNHESDVQLIERLLQAMHDSKVDYTSFFRRLSSVSTMDLTKNAWLKELFVDLNGIELWLEDYIVRLRAESSDDLRRKEAMDRVNPKYILRNHLAQHAIERAQNKDFGEIATLLKVLENPFAEQEQYEEYARPPSPNHLAIEVSCSS